MNSVELFSLIEELIENKKTSPKLINFAELKHATSGGKKELNEAFMELVKSGKIRVRQGKNLKLIEICDSVAK